MNDQLATRIECARRMLARIDCEVGQAVIDALADIAPAVAACLLKQAFGDIMFRPALSSREREVVTLDAATNGSR
jgi:4-carboxymuconolactone decarboxylase